MTLHNEVSETCEDCALSEDWTLPFSPILFQVFDFTEYIPFHPGGASVVYKYCGTEASMVFDMFHKTSTLPKYGPRYKIGDIGAAVVAVPATSTTPAGVYTSAEVCFLFVFFPSWCR